MSEEEILAEIARIKPTLRDALTTIERDGADRVLAMTTHGHVRDITAFVQVLEERQQHLLSTEQS